MTWEVLQGDALATLQTLEAATVDCVVTSPPYWGLRDYGVEGQLGLEPHPQQWLEHLWAIFDEVWRVMKPTGTGFANLGESYFSGVLGETRNHNRNSTKGGYANAITDDRVRKVK